MTKRGPAAAELRATALKRVEEEWLVHVDPVPKVRSRATSAELLTDRARALADLREGATLWVPVWARLGYSATDVRAVIDLLHDTGRKAGNALTGDVIGPNSPRSAASAAAADAEATLKHERFGRVRAEQAGLLALDVCPI